MAFPSEESFRPRALLIDFDGTLVDTEALAVEALWSILHPHDSRVTIAVIDDAFRGKDLDHCHDRLVAFAPGVDPDTIVRAVRSSVVARVSELRAEPGARELLSCGIPWRIVTNATRPHVERVCAATGLDAFLATGGIVGRESGARPKPAPDLYEYALAELGLGPRDALAVEDSAAGVRAARAAGCAVVRYAPARTAHPTPGALRDLRDVLTPAGIVHVGVAS